MVGEITAELCMEVREKIDELTHNSLEPIRIILTTEGGCCNSAIGLIDIIQSLPNHVTIEVQGYAWSVGAWFLQAADERVMTRNSTLMLHEGEETVVGTPRTIRAWLRRNKKQDAVLMRLLSKRTGKSVMFWKQRMNNIDVLYNASESKKLNLVDSIIC